MYKIKCDSLAALANIVKLQSPNITLSPIVSHSTVSIAGTMV